MMVSRMCLFQWRSLFFFGLLFLFGCAKSKVTQKPASEQVREGNHFTISCEYDTQFRTYFWYRQLPGKAPSLLLYISSAANEPTDHFTAEYLENGKKSLFHLSSLRLEDSGTYFCAVESIGSGLGKITFGSGTKLVVLPDLERSLPSVYKLKPFSDEKQGKAACLFTDYSPNPHNVGINKKSMKEVNGSVVVVKEDQSAKGTASYGIVLWGNDDDSFHCHVVAEKPKDSGTCLEEGGDITFETDERLNLLSLTVLGLRVIFLKTVAFNLLFTFRLWSR